MDEGRTDQPVFFAFDLLHPNGDSTAQLPLTERKQRLQRLFRKPVAGLRYSEHLAGGGPRFREHACKLGLEGGISKLADRPYAPGNRGIWVKSRMPQPRGIRGGRLGRTPRAAALTPAHFCSVTTPRMDG